ncbi:DnaD domain-containing protein [Fructilactobacillus fructivorans]|nr:DnaD domain-containing protein [Fructilactobacillus fructivorans]KRN13330.1 DnaD domain-containing protein [Fructilactobacillus fructivorans]
MFINNKTRWMDWFTVANQTLQNLTQLSRQAINKDRNTLKQKGFLDFKTNGNKATAYRLINLCDDDNAKGNNYRIKQPTIQEEQPKKKAKATNQPKSKELENNFNKLWQLYPKKQGKEPAFKAYKKAIKDGVTNEEIQKGIVSYKKQIEVKGTEQKFIKQGSTFFNQRSWQDEFDLKPDHKGKIKEELPDWAKKQEKEERKQAQKQKERLDAESNSEHQLSAQEKDRINKRLKALQN